MDCRYWAEFAFSILTQGVQRESKWTVSQEKFQTKAKRFMFHSQLNFRISILPNVDAIQNITNWQICSSHLKPRNRWSTVSGNKWKRRNFDAVNSLPGVGLGMQCEVRTKVFKILCVGQLIC
jgi:hypothetical protein